MIIKIKALERLRDVIASEIKELRGSICAGPATRDHRLKFPSLSIVPGRFSFLPDQADEKDPVSGEDRCPEPRVAIFNVGRWQGEIELQLGEKTPFKRYELEHKLEQVFLGNVSGTSVNRPDKGAGLRPGVLLVDVPECYNARCSFELENDTWENEKVFANEWYSVMRLTATIPALVRFKGVPTIDSLELSLTEDLETVVTGPSALTTLDVETVSVNPDGTITTI